MRFAFLFCLVCGAFWGGLYLVDPAVFFHKIRYLFRTSLLPGFNTTFTLRMHLSLLISLIIELMAVGWMRSSLRKLFHPDASTIRDVLTCMLFLCGVLDLLGYFLTFGAPYWFGLKLKELFPALNKLATVSSFGPPFLNYLVRFLLIDLFLYIGHRILHSHRFLWESHKYHHSADKMTIFTAHRNDLIARPVRNIISGIPLVFLGAHVGDALGILILFAVCTFLTHSEIDHDWGWIGKWILISPRFHRLHHSTNPDNFNSNYGFVFVFWDRLFGTYKEPVSITSFGLADSTYNRLPFFEGLFLSTRRMISQMKSKVSF